MSSEYSTGTIRTTLAAVPQRGYVLAAKALLVAGLSLALAVGIAFSAFFICETIFSNYGIHVSIHHPGTLRAVIGAGLYIGVLTLFALGLAAIIRHTAGAITALVAIVFIIPIVSNLLPDSWQQNFSRYLPANAGSSITQTVQITGNLSPWRGFIVFAIWAVVTVGVGGLLLRRRDV
jgi:ABC-2 type transport system permease protein